MSALFAATALLLPERLTHYAGDRPLEIGQIVEQLQAEVKTLVQENDKPCATAKDSASVTRSRFRRSPPAAGPARGQLD